MQVNDEYVVVKDMPVPSTREGGGAKLGDNGLQSLRVPAPEQPGTNAGIFYFLSCLFCFCFLLDMLYHFGLLTDETKEWSAIVLQSCIICLSVRRSRLR